MDASELKRTPADATGHPKVGDMVVCKSDVDDRGFRSITSACIQWIDGSTVHGERFAVVVPHETYAYHVEHPELGAYIPPRKMDCYAMDQMVPSDGRPLRDIVMVHAPAEVSNR